MFIRAGFHLVYFDLCLKRALINSIKVIYTAFGNEELYKMKVCSGNYHWLIVCSGVSVCSGISTNPPKHLNFHQTSIRFHRKPGKCTIQNTHLSKHKQPITHKRSTYHTNTTHLPSTPAKYQSKKQLSQQTSQIPPPPNHTFTKIKKPIKTRNQQLYE